MEQIELQGSDSQVIKRKKTRRFLKIRKKRRKKRKKLKPISRIVSLKRIKYQPSLPNYNRTSKRISNDVKDSKHKKRKLNKFSQSMYNMKNVKDQIVENLDKQLEETSTVMQDYSLFSNVDYIQQQPIMANQQILPLNLAFPNISVDLDQNLLTETMRRTSFFDQSNTNTNLLITRLE